MNLVLRALQGVWYGKSQVCEFLRHWSIGCDWGFFYEADSISGNALLNRIALRVEKNNLKR